MAGGSGCHPVREVAWLRAMTEAAQSRLTYIVGSRDDLYRKDAEEASKPEAMAEYAALAPGRLDYGGIPTTEFATFEADVEWMLGRLEASGYDRAIVFDLTQAEIGIAVVRVMVPGMHSEKRSFSLAGGR